MKIIDITPETQHLYFCCLEDWSEEMKEAGDHKQNWYEKMKNKGLRVKFALDDNNEIGGMIHYIPVEYSIFTGENLYVVLCIWVHVYKEGRGNFRKRGMGKALMKAAEEDVRKLGANGIAAWGVIIPVFMRASWFKKHGYKSVETQGMMRLMWKPFHNDAIPPRFIRQKKKPEKGNDLVKISMFRNGWCPAMNLAYERAIRASKEFEDKIEINEYQTTDKQIIDEWGITDALYIQGKQINLGPPPSFIKIRKKIARQIKKIS